MSFLLESGVDWLTVVISRQQVEDLDVEEPLGPLMTLLEDVETTRFFHRRVDIRFAGWDNDSRELYEIPEVVMFLKLLDRLWPYWFYFLTTEGGSLKMVALCLSDAKAAGPGLARRDNESFVRFMETHFSALNHVLAFSGQEELNVKVSEEVADYLLR